MIKYYIMNNGPITTGMCAPGGMAGAGKNIVTCDSWDLMGCGYVQNHAVAIVGWNTTDEAPGGGYWILKGTWGVGAGDNGYHYVAYRNCCVTWGGGCFYTSPLRYATQVHQRL
jgi:hypothetical protein